MKLKLALLFGSLLAAGSVSAQTLSTWLIPANVTTNHSMILAPNQVMEVLSLSLDHTTTTIGVTVNNQTVVFGTGGNLNVPTPLVVAGPAKVTFGRNTSSDEGNLLTFRVSQLQPTPAAPPQTVKR